jgi:pimeloyl-ACP methyl ester carboxylesterase
MSEAIIESSVAANGVRLHYATVGSGPLVVLVHGFPERWFSWRAQMSAIAAAGYRVAALDLRGYGLSDKPAEGYEIANLARDIAAFIRALGADEATVIGHDWGGGITWETVSRHPEVVARFAVLNCPHPSVLRRAVLTSPAQRARSWYMFFFNVPWLPERLISRDHGAQVARMFHTMAVDRSRFTPEAMEPYRESVARPADVTPMLAYYRRAIRQAFTPGAVSPYPVIDRPGLLLWAEGDQALGLELLAPHTRFARDLRIQRIPACGHFLMQEQPELVSRHLVHWLDETRVTPA